MRYILVPCSHWRVESPTLSESSGETPILALECSQSTDIAFPCALKLVAAGPPKGSKKARVEERSPKEKEAEGGTARGSSSAATAGRRGRTGDGAIASRGAAAKPFSIQLEFFRINRGASVCNRSLTLSPSSWLLLAHVSAIGQYLHWFVS